MITCQTCGAQNEAAAAFCGDCGATLSPAVDVDDTAVVPGSAKPAAAPTPEVAPEPDPLPAKATEPKSDPASEPGPEAVGAKPATPPVVPPPAPPQPSATPVPSPILDASSVACSNCGTINPIARSFCRKCANPLRAMPAATRSRRVGRDLVTKFLVAAVVATVVVVGGAALIQRFAPSDAAAVGPGVAVSVQNETGAELGFELKPADPQPLDGLPDTSTLQLASYEAPAASPGPSDVGPPARPKWWSDSIPRIPAITQFDGGRLQAVNCVMASGAMLARLGYGIVTTGSQLRALSRDEDGPTSFNDLQNAVFRGWGVHFSMGAASPLQFRALVYAGAGAELIVVYGEVPVGIRLQESFTGNHAIYIDAFRPDGPTGPEYYVMDPIGHTWNGYKGGWWPADVVERAATKFGGGRMVTAWTFAGGKVPFVHPVLPRSAYPPNTPDETPGPGETLGPIQTLGPGESLAPGQTLGHGGRDPFPFGDLPLDVNLTAGDPPPDVPQFPVTDFFKNVFLMEPDLKTSRCTTKPIPPDCPPGVVGIIGEFGLLQPTKEETNLKLLYANVIGPGVYRIIYEAPAKSDGSLLVWDKAGSLITAPSEAATLLGTPVNVATVTLDPAADYSFIASATTDGIRSISSVGTVKVTP